MAFNILGRMPAADASATGLSATPFGRPFGLRFAPGSYPLRLLRKKSEQMSIAAKETRPAVVKRNIMRTNDPLELLNKVQQTEAPPFMLTRIEAKIAARQAEHLPTSWQWSLAAVLALLIALNVAVFVEHAAAQHPDGGLSQFPTYQTHQLYADEI